MKYPERQIHRVSGGDNEGDVMKMQSEELTAMCGSVNVPKTVTRGISAECEFISQAV
jgi:hypothetical protein